MKVHYMVSAIVSWACVLTRQRWCEHLCGRTAKWKYRGTKTVKFKEGDDK
jgi:hypothetical protein